MAAMSIAFMAMLGSMILLQLYLQNVRGMSPLSTGLLVAPGGLAMGLLGPRVGRVYDARGSRVLVDPRRDRPRSRAMTGFAFVGAAHADLDDPGRPRGADDQPRRAVHAAVHDGPRRAAPAPVLPRQLAARHGPAGRRCHGHGAGRDDHVQPLRHPASPTAPPPTRPRSVACTGPSPSRRLLCVVVLGAGALPALARSGPTRPRPSTSRSTSSCPPARRPRSSASPGGRSSASAGRRRAASAAGCGPARRAPAPARAGR